MSCSWVWENISRFFVFKKTFNDSWRKTVYMPCRWMWEEIFGQFKVKKALIGSYW